MRLSQWAHHKTLERLLVALKLSLLFPNEIQVSFKFKNFKIIVLILHPF